MTILWHYLLIAILFVALDAIWLKSSQKLYARYLGELLAKKPDLRPAAVFYFLYVLGVTFFALEPALDGGSWLQALGRGALLGLIMFATYDLTNQATLHKWSTKITVIDLAWGTFSTGLVTLVAYLILQ